jgi:hypothetical protein
MACATLNGKSQKSLKIGSIKVGQYVRELASGKLNNRLVLSNHHP